MACGSLFHQSRISETSNILPDSLCFLVILRSQWGREGEHPGTEWLPTGMRSGVANDKIKGRSTHLKAKKGGRSTSNSESNKGSKNTTGVQRVGKMECSFISPPNVYMSSTGLVPGITGGYNACWCQRAL